MAAEVAMRNGPTFRESLLTSIFGNDAKSIYAYSGPVAERWKAIESGATPYGDPVERGLAFTVREARNRLRDMISGAQKITSVSQLVSYLRDNFMTPEIRNYGGAKEGTVHLRDEVTGESAPGAAVHVSLSSRGLRNLSGPNVVLSASSAPSAMETRYRDALRVAYKGQPVAYAGWESLKIGLPTALSRNVSLAYTVVDGVGYIGRPGRDARSPLECLGSAETTQSMLYSHYSDSRKIEAERLELQAREYMRQANTEPNESSAHALQERALLVRQRALKASGVPSVERFEKLSSSDQTKFLARHYIFNKNMTPRTPILLKDNYLVEAARIDSQLSAERLTKDFGVDFSRHWSDFHRVQTASRQEDSSPANVVDFNKIRAARNGGIELAPVDPGAAFGGVAGVKPAPVLKGGLVLVADERSPDLRICRYQVDGNHRDMPQFSTLHDLPPGDYRVLVMGAPYDRPNSYVVVDNDRNLVFQDTLRREHNMDGPSYIGAPGNDQTSPRWAVNGQVKDRHEWEAEVNPPQIDSPAEDESASPRFGYGAPSA